MADLAVLLSVGRHPASGRPRRAPTDAQALELALRLRGAACRAIHAGDPATPALRDYLGMGLDALTVLATGPQDDPVGPLAAHLAGLRLDMVLTGSRGEGGEDSGLVPYAVARALGWRMVPDVAAIEPGEGGATLLQARPRGQRRAVSVPYPFVAAVHPAAPPARPVAFGPARRGRIETVATPSEPDPFLAACEATPWRPRPKAMRAPRGGSALDRLRAATETKAGDGRLVVGATPEEAALAIYECLLERGLMGPQCGIIPVEES